MIDKACVAGLRLFSSVWAKYLLLSGKLRPANWNRVVLICFVLLLTSAFCLVRITRTTYGEVAGIESSYVWLTRESTETSQLPERGKNRSWRATKERDSSNIAEVSAGFITQAGRTKSVLDPIQGKAS